MQLVRDEQYFLNAVNRLTLASISPMFDAYTGIIIRNEWENCDCDLFIRLETRDDCMAT